MKSYTTRLRSDAKVYTQAHSAKRASLRITQNPSVEIVDGGYIAMGDKLITDSGRRIQLYVSRNKGIKLEQKLS